MDDLVKAALEKWPNVPACFGWLALDARGEWQMRDDRVQATGPFPQAKGARITHEKLREFIARNYDADEAGRWFFQNGPQRVYVELEVAPWVWRVHAPEAPRGGPPTIVSHTDRAVDSGAVESAWLDEHGRLLLGTTIGLGVVHTLDMDVAADAVEQGIWRPEPSTVAELALRFGHCLSPQARQAEEAVRTAG